MLCFIFIFNTLNKSIYLHMERERDRQRDRKVDGWMD